VSTFLTPERPTSSLVFFSISWSGRNRQHLLCLPMVPRMHDDATSGTRLRPHLSNPTRSRHHSADTLVAHHYVDCFLKHGQIPRLDPVDDELLANSGQPYTHHVFAWTYEVLGEIPGAGPFLEAPMVRRHALQDVCDARWLRCTGRLHVCHPSQSQRRTSAQSSSRRAREFNRPAALSPRSCIASPQLGD